MERTKEQKTLNIFAIIEMVAGIVGLVIGIMMFALGGAVFGFSSELITETGATAEQVNQIGGLFSGTGLAGIVTAILHIVAGVLMKKAVNDPTKYKGARTLVMASIALSIVGLVLSIISKDSQTIVNNLVSLLIDCYVFTLLNKIKNSVEA